jgi:hypothetical protein
LIQIAHTKCPKCRGLDMGTKRLKSRLSAHHGAEL